MWTSEHRCLCRWRQQKCFLIEQEFRWSSSKQQNIWISASNLLVLRQIAPWLLILLEISRCCDAINNNTTSFDKWRKLRNWLGERLILSSYNIWMIKMRERMCWTWKIYVRLCFHSSLQDLCDFFSYREIGR